MCQVPQDELPKNDASVCIFVVFVAGERASYFIGQIPEDKLPKDATAGRLLIGSLTFGKQPKESGGGDAPGAATLAYR